MRTPRVPRARRNGKNGQALTSEVRIERSPAFAEALLLASEDADSYNALVARLYEAVRPQDILEEMLVSDVIALQWELLRWRRFKFQILEGRGRTNLRKFLQENLSYDLYEDHFARILAEFLRENLPEDEVDQAEKLARGNAREEPDDADDKVLAVLEETDTDRHYLLAQAQAEKAIELVAAYTKRERGALALVTQLLDAQGLTISSVLGDGCTDNLESIERLDQLCAVAESRRNAALRELERRRAALAADLRRGLITAEEAQFEEVETAPTPLERAKAR